ncbi:hypothetical protein [Nostoc sp. NMS8]|uniref:hypothetical protein n=1 Tax=Nostoc sp. NMS8 TaxID=2815392 RepID=UPI0025CFC0DB|nr:hypothetical protein [Nostoc sp. NMS8]MBN3958136.1 hypothetical protein [Nostoc sp. NMS8]
MLAIVLFKHPRLVDGLQQADSSGIRTTELKTMSFPQHSSLDKKNISLLAPDCYLGECEKVQILLDFTILLSVDLLASLLAPDCYL